MAAGPKHGLLQACREWEIIGPMGGLQCLISLFPHLVRRPEANWTLTPKYGQVAVTTGVCSGPLPTNYYHLTTGLECSTNDVGIYYAYEITDLKGYLESYEVSWVQLVQIDWLENFSEPPLGTAGREVGIRRRSTQRV